MDPQKCYYCGVNLQNDEKRSTTNYRTLDHKIGVSQPHGHHHLANLVPACMECNQRKHDDDAFAFFKSRILTQPSKVDTGYKGLAHPQVGIDNRVIYGA
ncbi:HNH endonuclease [Corynebacterium pyruviciproducens]|uniref:HNH endonuclease n=1 Tax=Corynebacterium pyruviciproducens TaxID=598660 RepID=UPI003CCC4580